VTNAAPSVRSEGRRSRCGLLLRRRLHLVVDGFGEGGELLLQPGEAHFAQLRRDAARLPEERHTRHCKGTSTQRRDTHAPFQGYKQSEEGLRGGTHTRHCKGTGTHVRGYRRCEATDTTAGGRERSAWAGGQVGRQDTGAGYTHLQYGDMALELGDTHALLLTHLPRGSGFGRSAR
jgi:hypothetical protein